MIKSRAAVIVAVLSVAVLLSTCAKQQLVGKTTDVFGHALAGVSVKVEKTGFQTTSDSAGDYALDYAPGAFALVFSKAGFTTMRLDLNIAQLTRMPVETAILYPVPEQNGMYILGSDGLKPLVEARMRRTIQNNAFGGELRVSVPVNATVTVPSGTIRFIDKDPRQLLLATPEQSGLFYEAAFVFLASNVKLQRFIDASTVLVGDEKLQVRSATLRPGHYAFVEMQNNELQGPQPGRICFPFQVVEVPPPTTKR